MPLLIVEGRRYSRPTIVCDHCSTEIRRAVEGNYYWPDPENDCRVSPVAFVHKACSDAFARADPRRRGWSVMELDCLLVYLLNGLKVDLKRARAKAALLDAIG